MDKNFFKQYEGLKKTIKDYWSIYEGKRALFSSPYFHFSIFLTLITICFKSKEFVWQQYILQIIPNLLGFTLGGYAIFVSFSDRDFLKTILNLSKDENKTYIDKISAAFIHFIIVQVISLIFAVLSNAFNSNFLINFIGICLMYYSISLSAAAAFAIFDTIDLFKVYLKKRENTNSHDE